MLFQSLSKRSNLPGLRIGWIAGGAVFGAYLEAVLVESEQLASPGASLDRRQGEVVGIPHMVTGNGLKDIEAMIRTGSLPPVAAARGKVTKLEWTNPHAYVFVDVADAKTGDNLFLDPSAEMGLSQLGRWLAGSGWPRGLPGQAASGAPSRRSWTRSSTVSCSQRVMRR